MAVTSQMIIKVLNKCETLPRINYIKIYKINHNDDNLIFKGTLDDFADFLDGLIGTIDNNKQSQELASRLCVNDVLSWSIKGDTLITLIES